MYFLFVVLNAIEIILAFICAPYSCDWGNTVYVYAGIFSIAVSFILPFLQRNLSIAKRIGYSFLFAFITVAVWVLCFMLCGFSIMCRMF